MCTRSVEEGTAIGDAMQAHPRAFGEMAISMVRAGAEGGFLEDALARVAKFTEQQQDLKNRTAGALAYPAFLAIVGVSVVSVLIIFFVPKFEGLFARLKERGELPALTSAVFQLKNRRAGTFARIVHCKKSVLVPPMSPAISTKGLHPVALRSRSRYASRPDNVYPQNDPVKVHYAV